MRAKRAIISIIAVELLLRYHFCEFVKSQNIFTVH